MNDITKIAIYYIKKWFNFSLYPSQNKIIDYFFNNSNKITIKACTRYGKSQTIALGSIMYAIFIDNKRVGIIAPTLQKTKIIMGYILKSLSSCPQMSDIVDLDLMQLTKLERLKREVSKKRITFKNGSSIEVLTADIKGKGFSVMGFGYDLTVVDEVAELPTEVYSKIYRMLVENPDAKLIEIGNPWFLNHFYEHFNDDSWSKLSIPWQTAVSEGRLTKKAIEDQRKNLTDLEFDVLFNADFPKDIEHSIFKEDIHIKQAIRKKEFKTYDKILIGIDTAQGGKDYTVITIVWQKDDEYSFYDSIKMDENNDMAIVGTVSEYLHNKKWDKKDIIIKVDYPIGKGVADRIKELGYKVFGFRSGFKAIDKNRFFNLKAESIFGLADIFKQGRFYNLPANSQYTLQLKKWTFKIASDRQIQTIDPEDKSPDEADSLMIALSVVLGDVKAFTLDI